MDTKEYNRIITKYKITGNPSLGELKKILRNKFKEYHPDQHQFDSNLQKYVVLSQELQNDYEIVKKMIAGKFHQTPDNTPQKSNQNTNVNNNTKKDTSLGEKINDILDFIKRTRTNFDKDDDFKRTLDAMAETLKKSENDAECNRRAISIYRTIFFKYKTKFQIKLDHDNAKYRNDPYFYYHIYSKYTSALNSLESTSDFRDALAEFNKIVQQYNIQKNIYVNNNANKKESSKGM